MSKPRIERAYLPAPRDHLHWWWDTDPDDDWARADFATTWEEAMRELTDALSEEK